MKFREVKCSHEGCGKYANHGYAIYRVSPKPGPFIGKCEEHYGGKPMLIVKLIEDANFSNK